MAKMSALKNNWTPTAVADTTNFTDNGYMALLGGAATQLTNISEVYMGGLAAAAAPAQMIFARDSTIGATSLSGVLTSILHPSTGALANPVVAFSVSTTKPQRSASVQFLALGFNAFGGVVRWVAYPGEEIGMLGNTAALFGEVSLSHASSGTAGLMSAHIIYETL